MAVNILTNGQTVTLNANSDEFFATGEGRIRVFNTGTGQATGVEVVVSVPAGLTINGDTPTAGTFAVDTWSLATLDPCSTDDCNGEEEFLDLSFLVGDDSLQPYTITYTVTHDDSPDDVPADNAGSRTIGGISCSSFTDCVEDSAEFTTVSDTDSIDLTLTGVDIEADIILDPAVSNLLSVSATGVLADLNIGAGLTGNGASTPLAVTEVLASGTYTPTDSDHVNFADDTFVVMSQAQYMRVGNTVTVSGIFTADPIGGGYCEFQITLPIVSNFGATEDLAGAAFGNDGFVLGMGASVIGNVANNTASIGWFTGDGTLRTWSYTLTYQVI